MRYARDGNRAVTVGTAVVLDAPQPGWRAPATASAKGPCDNPSRLAAAWVDAAHRLALVEISYLGDDTCPGPASQLHLVSW